MATTARRQGILLPLWARIAIALQGITSTLPPAAVFLTALNIPHGYDPLFLLYMFLTFGFVGFGLVFIIALTIIGGMSTTLTLQTAWVLEVAKAVVATLAWCSMVFLLWPVGWMGGVVGCLWVG
ncbi:hypothetical protein BDV95DRAFT_584456 [Massariosphaeria phaeospora]|uniref:Uncharacterized protein n=1 Tax=Massariosphaeria phaeospora TaxID=100035 RepID=A0A7C8HZI2_9PLEO|nr:hypothetical protein BDV95DRAFT_584456 [Massariosphaeria phaeospora]